MSKESVIWAGRPQQAANLGVFILCALFAWLVIPLGIAVWKYLVIRATQYQLTTERYRTRYGVLNKTIDEIELYRVRDYRIDQPILLRVFGLSNLVMETSDRSHPVAVIRAIPHGEKVLHRLRRQVEYCRQAKRVRAVEFGEE